ncbi:hypothetical protein OAM67_00175 [bacterium]|nr:hypothetical protein [bacterium]
MSELELSPDKLSAQAKISKHAAHNTRATRDTRKKTTKSKKRKGASATTRPNIFQLGAQSTFRPLDVMEEMMLQASTFSTIKPFEICTPQNHPVRAKVVDIYDSDTIRINLFLPATCSQCPRQATQLTLRLRGVDGPEIRSRRPKEKQAALVSRDALLAFVLDGSIPPWTKPRLRRPDVQTLLQNAPQAKLFVDIRGVDKYGRALAELFNHALPQNEQMASEWLLQKGLVHTFNNAKKQHFADAELDYICSQHQSLRGKAVSESTTPTSGSPASTTPT